MWLFLLCYGSVSHHHCHYYLFVVLCIIIIDIIGVILIPAHVGTLNRKPTIDKDQVEEDLQILNQISDLCCHLYTPHPVSGKSPSPVYRNNIMIFMASP